MDDRIIEPSALAASRTNFGFTSFNNNNTSPWADYFHLRSYTDSSGGNDNLVMFRKDAIGIRVWQQTYGSASAYATYNDAVLANSSGIATVTGSFRAPAFYDSDNAAYYIDAANAGTALALNGGISFAVANPSITASSYFIASGGAYFSSGTVYAEANIKARGGIGNDTGAALTLTGGTGGYTLINGEARSPFFKDSDNTAFYANPAGTSLFSDTSSIRFGIENTNSTTGYGISLYNGPSAGQPTFGLMFAGTGTFGTHGGVNADWATYFTMNNTSGRGWIFRDTTNGNKASISNAGLATFDASVKSPIFYDSSNNAYYFDGDSTGTSINVAGAIVAAGNITAYSDIRVKSNIKPINDALNKLMRINGYTFTRTDLKDKHREYAGVIAQEIEAVLPEAIFESTNMKSVDYNATIALLIEAIKEQQDHINKLQQQVNLIKG